MPWAEPLLDLRLMKINRGSPCQMNSPKITLIINPSIQLT
ncbi:MAG: hypothetical protein RJA76_1002 [Bacteroidota bacterium]|jgi:hypothetical protein